ncbi:MAG: hypothetical protein JWN24_2669 [Phycisphaerales bacterium]|nr:hypothetical protein [Phycisphaerales bacterium]
MLNRSTMPYAMVLALAAMVGCNQPRPPYEPHAVQYASRQIHVDGSRLQSDTNIDQPPVVTRDQFGILHVMVPIRSVIDRNFTLQYQARFFNRDHGIVNEISWTDKPITPNTPDQIEVNSSGPAEDWELNLRLPPGFDR